jgi:hypothetical protein
MTRPAACAAVLAYTQLLINKHCRVECMSMCVSLKRCDCVTCHCRLHLPVGYHGRCSSIIPSGRGVHRPW